MITSKLYTTSNFLESIICDDVDCEKEIWRRLAMGPSTMTKLANICSLKTKTGLFPCVPSSDTWQRKLDTT